MHATTLSFTPLGAYPPDTTMTVRVPGGAHGIAGLNGGTLARSMSFSFGVENGALLRAEQLLAELNYLPYRWHPRRPVRNRHEYERAVYHPPAGRFLPIGQVPPQLAALWKPGAASQVLMSALDDFERSTKLPTTGVLDGSVWRALLDEARLPGHNASPAGFTYAVVNKRLPETLSIWQNGHMVLSSLANTGISDSPTDDGTFPVYLRLTNQVMTGLTPWGTKYADPVTWIAYFNGSDAVHYIYRSSYGFPQSFGCVELPLPAAERAWGYLQLGTLVTVIG